MQNEPIIPSGINPTATPPTDAAALGKRRLVIVEKIAWLERLNASEDFAHFIAFLTAGADSTQAAAENIDGNDANKRDAYAQRHFAYVNMAKWPAKQLASMKAELVTIDEKQRQSQK